MHDLIPSRLVPAVEEYRSLVDRESYRTEPFAEAMKNRPLKELAMEFACASAILSDCDPSEIPWKMEYTQEEKDAHPWIRDFFTNDYDLAMTYLKCDPPTGKVANPIVINMPICRDRQRARWRATSDRGTDSAMPSGIHGKVLLIHWYRIARHGIRRLRTASDTDKAVFVWAMHDAFILLRPFRDGNGRTARLLVQQMRRELKLYPARFKAEDRQIFRERTKFFNVHLFVPYLREKYGIRV